MQTKRLFLTMSFSGFATVPAAVARYLVANVPLGAVESPRSETAASEEELVEVQNISLPYLRSVTSVAVSNDGKFLYAAAFNASAVAVLTRDPQTGLLDGQDEITTPDLQAAVRVNLSKNNEYAVASAFGANAITLFKRDATTGRLTILDTARSGENEAAGLDFVIDARFSDGNRFLYTAASTGVGVFKLAGDTLSFVQFESANGQLNGVRGVAMSPSGTWIYAPAHLSGTLGVLRCDAGTGKLEVVQILKDGENDLNTLDGAFRAVCSADGKNVYLSSGRFKGSQAVTVFATSADGKLQLVEQHINGAGRFTDFQGGNDIAVSPDGTRVYVVASVSDRLFRFRRDAASGKLTFLGSQQVGVNETPGSAGVCFSPDGKFVYVADENAGSIVVYKDH
jgi:6-phosphogluconolactonase (cycloisomerase 2 family)